MNRKEQAGDAVRGKERRHDLTPGNRLQNDGKTNRKNYRKPTCTKHERVYDMGIGSA